MTEAFTLRCSGCGMETGHTPVCVWNDSRQKLSAYEQWQADVGERLRKLEGAALEGMASANRADDRIGKLEADHVPSPDLRRLQDRVDALEANGRVRAEDARVDRVVERIEKLARQTTDLEGTVEKLQRQFDRQHLTLWGLEHQRVRPLERLVNERVATSAQVEVAVLGAAAAAEKVAALVKAARGLLKYASPYSAGWTCNGAHIDQLTAALKPFDEAL